MHYIERDQSFCALGWDQVPHACNRPQKCYMSALSGQEVIQETLSLQCGTYTSIIQDAILAKR